MRSKTPGTAEDERLAQNKTRKINWQRRGTYLPERQWGTVREDYSYTATYGIRFPMRWVNTEHIGGVRTACSGDFMAIPTFRSITELGTTVLLPLSVIVKAVCAVVLATIIGNYIVDESINFPYS